MTAGFAVIVLNIDGHEVWRGEYDNAPSVAQAISLAAEETDFA
jgi:hypothetical protein